MEVKPGFAPEGAVVPTGGAKGCCGLSFLPGCIPDSPPNALVFTTGARSGNFLFAAPVVVVPSGTSLAVRIGLEGLDCAGGEGADAEALGVVLAAESLGKGSFAIGGGDIVLPMLELVAASPGLPCCTVRTSPFCRPRDLIVASWSEVVSSSRGGWPVRTVGNRITISAPALDSSPSSRLLDHPHHR